jgi:hypothetical protein
MNSQKKAHHVRNKSYKVKPLVKISQNHGLLQSLKRKTRTTITRDKVVEMNHLFAQFKNYKVKSLK